MKKGFVGFIFGVVSVIAALLSILKKMAGVTNVVSHLKDDLSEGVRYLIFGENDTTKLRKYSGRYPFNSYYSDNDDSYSYRGPYNKYSSSAIYTHRRLHDIMHVEFESKEKAEKAKEKIIDTLNSFGKITIEDVFTILGSNEIEYLDSKFGWYKVGCESETIRVLSVPCNTLYKASNAVWYISMTCPPVKIA